MMYGQDRTNSVLATIVLSAGDRDRENSTWRIQNKDVIGIDKNQNRKNGAAAYS